MYRYILFYNIHNYNEERRRTVFIGEDEFNLNERIFVKRYRLNKSLTRNLIEVIDSFSQPRSRVSAISTTAKVLAALSFFATGSYQTIVGTAAGGLSQPSVSRCIHEVAQALNHESVINTWIKYPSNLVELRNLRNKFYTECGIPAVGVIDCTHVAIVAPPINSIGRTSTPEHVFVNRKHYHSLNVQLICDPSMKILNIDASFPGCTHDSFIWNQSPVKDVLETLFRRGNNTFYLLGDSGYGLRPWLITPLTSCTSDAEQKFDKTFKCTRSIIERCNGLLKARFQCLLRHRTLHYSPKVSAEIINACAVLHNMCIEGNIIDESITDSIQNYNSLLQDGIFNTQANNLHQSSEPDLIKGKKVRENIIRTYFTGQRDNQ